MKGFLIKPLNENDWEEFLEKADEIEVYPKLYNRFLVDVVDDESNI